MHKMGDYEHQGYRTFDSIDAQDDMSVSKIYGITVGDNEVMVFPAMWAHVYHVVQLVSGFRL